MPKDLEIPLCMDCSFRPEDPETGVGVEGGINIAERFCEAGRVAVLYSQEDPRIHAQFSATGGSDEAVRLARSCTPIAAGLEAGLGSFEKRIKVAVDTQPNNLPTCRIGAVLVNNNNLPEGLLYQVERVAGSGDGR